MLLVAGWPALAAAKPCTARWEDSEGLKTRLRQLPRHFLVMKFIHTADATRRRITGSTAPEDATVMQAITLI
jgi:hypothetical protein